MQGGHNGFIFRTRREEDARTFVREWYRRSGAGSRLATLLLVLAAVAFVVWAVLS